MYLDARRARDAGRRARIGYHGVRCRANPYRAPRPSCSRSRAADPSGGTGSGGPAHAREHGVPSAVGDHCADRSGHARHRGRAADRSRMGRRPGALPARGHAGRRVQDRRARQRREHRRGRRDPLRLSGRAADPRPGARVRAAATSWPPKRWCTRCSSCCCRRRRSSTRTASRSAGSPRTTTTSEPTLAGCAARWSTPGCEYVLVTGTHEHSREIVNTLYGKSGVVRTDSWPRLPGQFHGAGVTLAAAIAAMLANGLEHARGGARGAGLHVEHAEKGLPARHGPASCPTGCSGRARRARRAATSADARRAPMHAAATERRARAARAPARPLRGHAGLADTAALRRAGATRRSRRRARRCSTATRTRDACARAAQARALVELCRVARRPVHRQRRRGAGRATSVRTACTSARTTASRVRARDPRPGRGWSASSCYDDSRARTRGGRRRRRLHRVRQLLPVAVKPHARRASLDLVPRARSLGVPHRRDRRHRCGQCARGHRGRRRRGRRDRGRVRARRSGRGRARPRGRVASSFDRAALVDGPQRRAVRARAAHDSRRASTRPCARSVRSAARRASSCAAKGRTCGTPTASATSTTSARGARRSSATRIPTSCAPCRRPRCTGCRSARRPRSRSRWPRRWCGACRRSSSCASCRRAPRRRCRRCGSRAAITGRPQDRQVRRAATTGTATACS